LKTRDVAPRKARMLLETRRIGGAWQKLPANFVFQTGTFFGPLYVRFRPD